MGKPVTSSCAPDVQRDVHPVAPKAVSAGTCDHDRKPKVPDVALMDACELEPEEDAPIPAHRRVHRPKTSKSNEERQKFYIRHLKAVSVKAAEETGDVAPPGGGNVEPMGPALQRGISIDQWDQLFKEESDDEDAKNTRTCAGAGLSPAESFLPCRFIKTDKKDDGTMTLTSEKYADVRVPPSVSWSPGCTVPCRFIDTATEKSTAEKSEDETEAETLSQDSDESYSAHKLNAKIDCGWIPGCNASFDLDTLLEHIFGRGGCYGCKRRWEKKFQRLLWSWGRSANKLLCQCDEDWDLTNKIFGPDEFSCYDYSCHADGGIRRFIPRFGASRPPPRRQRTDDTLDTVVSDISDLSTFYRASTNEMRELRRALASLNRYSRKRGIDMEDLVDELQGGRRANMCRRPLTIVKNAAVATSAVCIEICFDACDGMKFWGEDVAEVDLVEPMMSYVHSGSEFIETQIVGRYLTAPNYSSTSGDAPEDAPKAYSSSNAPPPRNRNAAPPRNRQNRSKHQKQRRRIAVKAPKVTHLLFLRKKHTGSTAEF